VNGSRATPVIRLTLLLLTCLGSAALSQQAPEFTGVWMQDRARSGRWPAELPYTSAGRAAVSTFEENYRENPFDPGRFCVFQGMPVTMFITAYWTEFIQRPERMTIIFEISKPPRRIYTDGRGHPDDLYPTKNGHSIGQWEDNTLVVETVGLVAREGPVPGSEQQRIVERIRLEKDDIQGSVLVDELTIHDPIIFTEPIIITLYYTPWSDEDLLEYECSDGPWRDYLRELKEQRDRADK